LKHTVRYYSHWLEELLPEELREEEEKLEKYRKRLSSVNESEENSAK